MLEERHYQERQVKINGKVLFGQSLQDTIDLDFTDPFVLKNKKKGSEKPEAVINTHLV